MLMNPRSADTCLTLTVINWLSAPVITDNENTTFFGDYSHVFHVQIARSPRQRLSREDGETRDKKLHSFKSAFGEYFKLAKSEDVLKRLDSGTPCRVIAAELHCGKTQIGRIRVDRMAIMAEWSSGGRPDLKYVKRRKTTYEELNNLVWEWFTTARSKDLPVSGRLIQVLY